MRNKNILKALQNYQVQTLDSQSPLSACGDGVGVSRACLSLCPDTHPNFNPRQIKFDLRIKQVLTPWTKVRVFQTYFLSSVFHWGITAKSAFLIFREKQIHL